MRHLAALPWNEVLAAVAEMRARVAAEQAAKAAKEEGESAAKETAPASKTAKPKPRPPLANPAYDQGTITALAHVAGHANTAHFAGNPRSLRRMQAAAVATRR